jgi:hypothetical protein
MTAPERQPGMMIAMFDIPDELEDDFNEWYNEEHVPEKVGRVPGFLRARRYKSLDGRPNHVCVYELEDISVVTDPTYLGNYKSGSERTVFFKSKARTFYRSVYTQIADFEGIPLPEEK